jgi:hypothetical protein
MSIGLKVDNIVTELGSAGFVHGFFSTVSRCLEPDGWATRFPVLLNALYQGTLQKRQANDALGELDTIRQELKRMPPQSVVWDIADQSRQPPWGNFVSPDITDLSNYFVTSTGRDLLEVMAECLQYFAAEGAVCSIVEI